MKRSVLDTAEEVIDTEMAAAAATGDPSDKTCRFPPPLNVRHQDEEKEKSHQGKATEISSEQASTTLLRLKVHRCLFLSFWVVGSTCRSPV